MKMLVVDRVQDVSVCRCLVCIQCKKDGRRLLMLSDRFFKRPSRRTSLLRERAARDADDVKRASRRRIQVWMTSAVPDGCRVRDSLVTRMISCPHKSRPVEVPKGVSRSLVHKGVAHMRLSNRRGHEVLCVDHRTLHGGAVSSPTMCDLVCDHHLTRHMTLRRIVNEFLVAQKVATLLMIHWNGKVAASLPHAVLIPEARARDFITDVEQFRTHYHHASLPRASWARVAQDPNVEQLLRTVELDDTDGLRNARLYDSSLSAAVDRVAAHARNGFVVRVKQLNDRGILVVTHVVLDVSAEQRAGTIAFRDDGAMVSYMHAPSHLVFVQADEMEASSSERPSTIVGFHMPYIVYAARSFVAPATDRVDALFEDDKATVERRVHRLAHDLDAYFMHGRADRDTNDPAPGFVALMKRLRSVRAKDARATTTRRVASSVTAPNGDYVEHIARMRDHVLRIAPLLRRPESVAAASRVGDALGRVAHIGEVIHHTGHVVAHAGDGVEELHRMIQQLTEQRDYLKRENYQLQLNDYRRNAEMDGLREQVRSGLDQARGLRQDAEDARRSFSRVHTVISEFQRNMEAQIEAVQQKARNDLNRLQEHLRRKDDELKGKDDDLTALRQHMEDLQRQHDDSIDQLRVANKKLVDELHEERVRAEAAVSLLETAAQEKKRVEDEDFQNRSRMLEAEDAAIRHAGKMNEILRGMPVDDDEESESKEEPAAAAADAADARDVDEEKEKETRSIDVILMQSRPLEAQLRIKEKVLRRSGLRRPLNDDLDNMLMLVIGRQIEKPYHPDKENVLIEEVRADLVQRFGIGSALAATVQPNLGKALYQALREIWVNDQPGQVIRTTGGRRLLF